ncbi:MAG: CvpA family protein [Oscillospiraceae bacterium]|nr:CvpA family protein [Oscillospiraceae bacterium]
MNINDWTARTVKTAATAKTGKTGKKTVRNIIITVVFALVLYYFMLPPMNFQATQMYTYFIVVFLVYCLLTLLSIGGVKQDFTPGEVFRSIKKNCIVPGIIIGLLLVVVIIGSLISSVLFHPKAYSSLITVEKSDFATDVAEISFDQIPMLDSGSANVLADRKLGELSDLVSQFAVDNSTAQINYKDRPVRVTYLNYGDFFKWINNRKSGLPAYISIDMVSQEVSVVRTGEGMRYSPSELFFREVQRHLRLQYPTYIFSDVNFEVDESGTPYWVATVITKRIGLFGGEDAKGIVLMNAINGECQYYDVPDIPQWVDRVFTADLIIKQYDYYGKYHNGFLNAFFGQSDCTRTTDGYNYIAQNDDVWLYTGITSVVGDESNVGFILVNQRTKEAKYYSVAGAEEFSAMNSAQGAVQQYKYSATFPLLLNINGQPSYFMALKDASSLVKMYAMVNVQQYQIVATGNTVAECESQYIRMLIQNKVLPDGSDTGPISDTETVSGVISDIRSAVLDGTTYYYVSLTDGDGYYRVSAAECEIAVILNAGDKVTVQYSKSDGKIQEAVSLTSP